LAPIYVVLLPIAIGISVWFPDVRVGESLGAILITPACLAVLLQEKGRDRGLKLQSELWGSWGGPLLTQYMRHENSRVNRFLKAEYHQKLQKLLPNLEFPTKEMEAEEPAAADEVYGAYAQHIVNVVREDPKRFWTAFGENCSLGFRRNLLGLRLPGIVCSALGTGSTVARLIQDPLQEAARVSWVISILTCVGLLANWVFSVNPAWVRVAYDAYALRTLESVAQMGEEDGLG